MTVFLLLPIFEILLTLKAYPINYESQDSILRRVSTGIVEMSSTYDQRLGMSLSIEVFVVTQIFVMLTLSTFVCTTFFLTTALALLCLLIILGMIMDDTSAALLAVPILYPMMQAIGVNTYQFAALAVINIGMGNITPPTAPFLYLTARIFKTDASRMIKPVMA